MKQSSPSPYEAIRSDTLVELRQFLSSYHQLRGIVGEIAQFRIVLDTNMALRDIMWLAKREDRPDLQTSLLEAIHAETMEVFAPPQLLMEVEEKMPIVAAQRDIPLDAMRRQWERYVLHIQILDAPSHHECHTNIVDADDLPFVELARHIGAIGVLSDDRHITRMGGTRLTLDFVLSVRDYSRSAAIDLTIRLGTVSIAMISVAALAITWKTLDALRQGFFRLPPWVPSNEVKM